MKDSPEVLVQNIAIISDGSIEIALDRFEIPGGYVAGSDSYVPEESTAP